MTSAYVMGFEYWSRPSAGYLMTLIRRLDIEITQDSWIPRVLKYAYHAGISPGYEISKFSREARFLLEPVDPLHRR